MTPPSNLLDAHGYRVATLWEWHASAIVGLLPVPNSAMVITAGADGSVRAYDYRYSVRRSGCGPAPCC